MTGNRRTGNSSDREYGRVGWGDKTTTLSQGVKIRKTKSHKRVRLLTQKVNQRFAMDTDIIAIISKWFLNFEGFLYSPWQQKELSYIRSSQRQSMLLGRYRACSWDTPPGCTHSRTYQQYLWTDENRTKTTWSINDWWRIKEKKESDKLVARKKPAKIFIFLAKRKEEKK